MRSRRLVFTAETGELTSPPASLHGPTLPRADFGVMAVSIPYIACTLRDRGSTAR